MQFTIIKIIALLLSIFFCFLSLLLLITLAIYIYIYIGFASVEKATEWKERNIRSLHLVAGIIMRILGILVVSGII